MELWLDALVVALILSNLKLLGSSRLSACIRVVAGQGSSWPSCRSSWEAPAWLPG